MAIRRAIEAGRREFDLLADEAPGSHSHDCDGFTTFPDSVRLARDEIRTSRVEVLLVAGAT
jgi:hypothetical protein